MPCHQLYGIAWLRMKADCARVCMRFVGVHVRRCGMQKKIETAVFHCISVDCGKSSNGFVMVSFAYHYHFESVGWLLADCVSCCCCFCFLAMLFFDVVCALSHFQLVLEFSEGSTMVKNELDSFAFRTCIYQSNLSEWVSEWVLTSISYTD